MIRVITWNIHGGTDADGKSSTLQITDTLAVNTADVVVLQEVPNLKWANALGETLGMFVFFQQTNSATGMGNLILSTKPADAVTYSWFRTWGFSCSREQRGAVAVSLEDVTVVCTHLGADITMLEQFFGAQRVHTFTKTLPGKVILAGDFNAHYFSPAMCFMRWCGWKDMWRKTVNRVHGYFAGCTFHTKLPFQRIDYIMCKSCSVTPTRAHLVCGDVPESDHRGVLVEMSM